jgi:hypothetical protein
MINMPTFQRLCDGNAHMLAHYALFSWSGNMTALRRMICKQIDSRVGYVAMCIRYMHMRPHML